MFTINVKQHHNQKKPGCQQKGKNQFQWKEEPGPVIEPRSSGTPYRLYYMGWVSVGREESMSMKRSDRTRYQAQDLWLLRQTPYRLHYMALISAAQTAEGKNQSKWKEVPRPGIKSGTSGSWARHYTSCTIWPGYQRKGEKSVSMKGSARTRYQTGDFWLLYMCKYFHRCIICITDQSGELKCMVQKIAGLNPVTLSWASQWLENSLSMQH